MGCSPSGSSVHGIFHARILAWVPISFSRGSSWLRGQTRISCLSCTGRWIFYPGTAWKVQWVCSIPSHSVPWQGTHSRSNAELLERQKSLLLGPSHPKYICSMAGRLSQNSLTPWFRWGAPLNLHRPQTSPWSHGVVMTILLETHV